MAPAKTPEPVIKRLTEEAAKAVKAPSVKERFAQDDAVAYGSTPAEFATFIKQEQARWSEVVKKAKLKAD